MMGDPILHFVFGAFGVLMAAFVIGMPRAATPLVALLVAAGIGLALLVRSADGSVVKSGPRSSVIEGTIVSR